MLVKADQQSTTTHERKNTFPQTNWALLCKAQNRQTKNVRVSFRISDRAQLLLTRN